MNRKILALGLLLFFAFGSFSNAQSTCGNLFSGKAAVGPATAIQEIFKSTLRMRLQGSAIFSSSVQRIARQANYMPIHSYDPQGLTFILNFAKSVEHAGNQQSVALTEARKILIGLVEALALYETADVPVCHVGKVGQVQGCVSEGSQALDDNSKLMAYMKADEGVGEDNAEVIHGRRLQFAMLSGLGVREYIASRSAHFHRHSAYADLWQLFVDEQGKNAGKPVTSFIHAFKHLQDKIRTAGVKQHALLASSLTQSMDNFFEVCGVPAPAN